MSSNQAMIMKLFMKFNINVLFSNYSKSISKYINVTSWCNWVDNPCVRKVNNKFINLLFDCWKSYSWCTVVASAVYALVIRIIVIVIIIVINTIVGVDRCTLLIVVMITNTKIIQYQIFINVMIKYLSYCFFTTINTYAILITSNVVFSDVVLVNILSNIT